LPSIYTPQTHCWKAGEEVQVNKPDHRIKGLGEVSIRVRDLAAMCAFYEDVVGLEVLRREESFVFFEIAEGYGGHSQNLALFDASERTLLEWKSQTLSSDQSTLHHIALNIDLEDYESEMRRLQGLGLDVQATEHPWIHVRSLYFPTRREICWSSSVTTSASVVTREAAGREASGRG
jgi:catechol 2,3-dioxygenase-like lactoylglutathione lyase family enzyme